MKFHAPRGHIRLVILGNIHGFVDAHTPVDQGTLQSWEGISKTRPFCRRILGSSTI
jgi:hypothetical protein